MTAPCTARIFDKPNSSIILLDEADVDALATPQIAIRAANEAAMSLRRGLSTGRVQVGDEVTWMRVLVGIVPHLDILGYKEFHRVGRRVRYHINVFQRSSANCIGVVDGRRITSLRTAFTAALAFAHRFGDHTVSLGVVGSGEEAKEGLRALAAVGSIDRVRVYSPTPANREEFAAVIGSELSLEVSAVSTVAEALDGAEAGYIATSSAGPPFLTFDEVSHMNFLAAIGSTRPEQRELVGDVLANASHVVVDCEDARHEPGDVIEARDGFGFNTSTALLLAEYLDRPARDFSDGLVVLKTIGSVEQDLTLAHFLLEEAVRRGAGRRTREIGSLRIMR